LNKYQPCGRHVWPGRFVKQFMFTDSLNTQPSVEPQLFGWHWVHMPCRTSSLYDGRIRGLGAAVGRGYQILKGMSLEFQFLLTW